MKTFQHFSQYNALYW